MSILAGSLKSFPFQFQFQEKFRILLFRIGQFGVDFNDYPDFFGNLPEKTPHRNCHAGNDVAAGCLTVSEQPGFSQLNKGRRLPYPWFPVNTERWVWLQPRWVHGG
jgi:hypothetical protein